MGYYQKASLTNSLLSEVFFYRWGCARALWAQNTSIAAKTTAGFMAPQWELKIPPKSVLILSLTQQLYRVDIKHKKQDIYDTRINKESL